MRVKYYKDIEAEAIRRGVKMRWVISEEDGAENFFMRVIEYGPEAEDRPLHWHDYEHEIYILEGKGVLVGDQGEEPLKKGDVVFISPNEKHQIRPLGELRIICLIPSKGIHFLPESN